MKKYFNKLTKFVSTNSKLFIGLGIGLLISLPLGAYAFKSHNLSNNQSVQNQPSTEQTSTQDHTTTTTPATTSTNPTTTNPNPSSQSGSTSSSYKPSGSTQSTQSTQAAPTLLSCTNNNDVPYESHSVYHNGAGKIPGANGWSKNCVYSDGHSTKETYVQPTTEYFYVYFYIPDSTNARNQCTSYIGAAHAQAIDECVAIATTTH